MGKNSKHKVKTMPKRKVHSSNSSHPKKHETKHKVKHTETPKYETKHVSKNNNTGLWIAVFLLSILVVTAVATDGFKTLFDKKDI